MVPTFDKSVFLAPSSPILRLKWMCLWVCDDGILISFSSGCLWSRAFGYEHSCRVGVFVDLSLCLLWVAAVVDVLSGGFSWLHYFGHKPQNLSGLQAAALLLKCSRSGVVVFLLEALLRP